MRRLSTRAEVDAARSSPAQTGYFLDEDTASGYD